MGWTRCQTLISRSTAASLCGSHCAAGRLTPTAPEPIGVLLFDSAVKGGKQLTGWEAPSCQNPVHFNCQMLVGATLLVQWPPLTSNRPHFDLRMVLLQPFRCLLESAIPAKPIDRSQSRPVFYHPFDFLHSDFHSQTHHTQLFQLLQS